MIYSPVKIYNVFLEPENNQLPDVEFTGCIFGPNLPLIKRQLNGTINNNNIIYNFIYLQDEYPVNYNLYISPVSKRKYVHEYLEFYFEDNQKVKYDDLINSYSTDFVNNIVIQLQNNAIYFDLGDIKIISNTGNNRYKIKSTRTSNEYSLRNGDIIEYVENNNIIQRTINAIVGSSEIELDNNITINLPVIAKVIRKFNANDINNILKLYAKYRIFKSWNEVIKIDNTSKIRQYFGEIEKGNLIAFALFLAIKSMREKKSIYAIANKEQDNYNNSFELFKNYYQGDPKTILYENVLLSFDETAISSFIDLIDESNDPLFSNPVRGWVAFDLPLYDYEWRDFYGSVQSLENYVGQNNANNYVAIAYDNTNIFSNNTIQNILIDGNIIRIDLANDITLANNQNYLLLLKNGNNEILYGIYFEFLTHYYDNTNYILSIPLNEAIFILPNKNINLTNINKLNTTLHNASFNTLNNLNNSYLVFKYSLKPMQLNDIKNIWINKANNERINVVNPWVFDIYNERIPGFYLASLRAGFTIGTYPISRPTSGWGMPRDIIYDTDYNDRQFGPSLFQDLIDNGIDNVVVYDGLLQSWKQRTSYKGNIIDKKYQSTMRALDYLNWRMKRICNRYARRYELSEKVIGQLKTQLNMLMRFAKSETKIGPVVGAKSKILDLIIVRSPADIPPDIPVSMETGIIIKTQIELVRPINEIIIYNIITGE